MPCGDDGKLFIDQDSKGHLRLEEGLGAPLAHHHHVGDLGVLVAPQGVTLYVLGKGLIRANMYSGHCNSCGDSFRFLNCITLVSTG